MTSSRMAESCGPECTILSRRVHAAAGRGHCIGTLVSSGFANTDLDLQLKKHGIHQLIVIGLRANTCIDSTVRYPAELGYEVTLVKDAIGGFSWDEMKVTLELNAPNYARAILSITSEIHGHLDLEDMRAGINRLSFQSKRSALPAPDSTKNRPPFAANLLLSSSAGESEGPGAASEDGGTPGPFVVGATGFEPATTCTPRLLTPFPEPHQLVQSVAPSLDNLLQRATVPKLALRLPPLPSRARQQRGDVAVPLRPRR